MKKRYYYIALIAILMILTSIFIYRYVRNESPVYIFDYSGYYEVYKGYSRELLSTPKQFVIDVISSVRNSDYNPTSVLLLLPFYIAFKTSRMGYILGLGLCYVVPTIVLTIILARRMILQNKEVESNDEKNNNGRKKINNTMIFSIFLCIATFLYTRWWSPTLRGLPDIIAVIPLIIAALIIQKISYLDKNKKYIPILIGFILYLPFLFRRYFVYAVIGFYVAIFIIELIEFFKVKKEDKKQKFINATINFMLSGFTTLICVLILQMPLVQNILNSNYSEAYSAYQAPILAHITKAINEFGYVILLLSFVGIIFTLIKKEHRRNGLFCLINIIVCYMTFMTVQAMGVHHYLTISTWIFILFVYGIYAIWSLIKNNILKIIWLSSIIVLMSLNFATTYIFRETRIPVLTQYNKYCKFYYENFNEVERLIKDIDELISKGNLKFSAFASSETLSDNLIDLLGTDKMKSSIVYTSAIDLRDGISFNSLMSDYIVVTDIPQVGTSVEGQRVVSVPNNAIINGTSIGKAYSLVSGPYVIQGGVNAYIYKKDRPFSEDEVSEFMKILKGYYPQWENQYNKLDEAILMSERKLGEGIGDVRRYKYETLYFLPGFDETIYTINLNQKIKSLDLKLYIEGQMNLEDPTNGNVLLTITADDETLYKGEITRDKSDEIILNLSNYEKLTFIVDKNEYLNCDWLYIDINNVEFNK